MAIVLRGALLGAGYTFLKARRSAAASAAATAAAQAAADKQDDSLSNINAGVKDAILAQYASLTERMAYYNGSLSMQIDPSNEYVARAIIFLNVPSSWSSDVLKTAYAAYANEMWSGEAVAQLAEQMGTTTAYLRELASLKTVNAETDSSGAATIVVEQSEEDSGSDNMLLALRAIGTTEENAAALREALLSDLSALTEPIAASVGTHSFDVVSRSAYVAVDYSLLDKQTPIANSISSQRQTITTNEKNLKASSSSSSSVVATPKVTVSKKALAKRGILGGAAAFLLYGFVLCLRYLLGGKLEVRPQLVARYSMPELGSYGDGRRAYYRHDGPFDRWLRKLMGMSAPAPEATVEGMVAANVRLYAGDAQRVLVSSSVESDRAAALAARLGELVPGRAFVCASDLELLWAGAQGPNGASIVEGLNHSNQGCRPCYCEQITAHDIGVSVLYARERPKQLKDAAMQTADCKAKLPKPSVNHGKRDGGCPRLAAEEQTTSTWPTINLTAHIRHKVLQSSPVPEESLILSSANCQQLDSVVSQQLWPLPETMCTLNHLLRH